MPTQGLRRMLRRLLALKERVLWGGRLRERVLVDLLRRHYASVFRREWVLAEAHPHFESQHAFFFQLGYGFQMFPAQAFARGFLGVEVLRKQDALLDIGCGDGFFSRRFFAPACARVDAVDIDPSAIAVARVRHGAPTVRYHLTDVIANPFPEPRYECVIWDGGLGHLSAADSRLVLKKIADALADDGVFAGSESLGREGADHLQVFQTPQDACRLFEPFFRDIRFRVMEYSLPWASGFVRREVYWRCSNHPERLGGDAWTTWASESTLKKMTGPTG